MGRDSLTTSALTRLVRLGGLAGRVGASMAGNLLSGALQDLEKREVQRRATRRQNAEIVAETLGRLKGVPMKIGQMLSLNEGLLPPEMAEIFSSLQQDAPAVSFEAIHDQIQTALGGAFRRVREIDPRPHAAASIGQVHRGVLTDGRRVVFKVQYPGIDRVIRADMKNLKGVLKLVFSLLTEMDTEPVWQELNDRLMEEIDYRREAAHMRRMARLWVHRPRVIVPAVVEALSTRHVLCMDYVEGIAPAKACSRTYPARLRDRWGRVLLEIFLNGLFRDRFLHADPNLANFAFLEDGRVALFDYGCVKAVPAALAKGYARLTRAVLDERYDRLPGLLQGMGVHYDDGQPVPLELVSEYADVMRVPFAHSKNYRFTPQTSIYDQVLALGRKHWSEAAEFVFPRDVIFIDRTIVGHFGNLARLRAAGPWRRMLIAAADAALSPRRTRPART